jgi:hypothetical protein
MKQVRMTGWLLTLSRKPVVTAFFPLWAIGIFLHADQSSKIRMDVFLQNDRPDFSDTIMTFYAT